MSTYFSNRDNCPYCKKPKLFCNCILEPPAQFDYEDTQRVYSQKEPEQLSAGDIVRSKTEPYVYMSNGMVKCYLCDYQPASLTILSNRTRVCETCAYRHLADSNLQ